MDGPPVGNRSEVPGQCLMVYCRMTMTSGTEQKSKEKSAGGRFLSALGLGRKAPAAVPDNTRVYAVGDIHGCLDQLVALHERIAQDAEGYAGNKHIIYLGDFIDRGRSSKGVIDAVRTQIPANCTPHYIKGNHDQALLDFLADPETYRVWKGFGAGDTLLSYGVRPPLFDSLAPIEAARDALIAAMPPEHLDFFRGLELKVEIGGYVFVHAGIRPGVPLSRQLEEDLLWIREEFLSSQTSHEKVVVHGHTPLTSPVRTSNRISIDTGAYATGILTAAVLEGTTCRFLQVGR
jgi:serine/threonine protein phosphatase 1